jgi:hypothetical protein
MFETAAISDYRKDTCSTRPFSLFFFSSPQSTETKALD